MSDTPRTNNYIENFPGSRREPRLLDFARRLETELADKDRQLTEARAEIERKDKLIAQMRKALQEAMVLCDAVPTRAHDMAKDYHLREIGRIVNVKGLYHVVKAALSAAERMSK